MNTYPPAEWLSSKTAIIATKSPLRDVFRDDDVAFKLQLSCTSQRSRVILLQVRPIVTESLSTSDDITILVAL